MNLRKRWKRASSSIPWSSCPRGAHVKAVQDIMAMAEKAIKGRRIHALSLTDNAGGHPALFPNVLGRETAGWA